MGQTIEKRIQVTPTSRAAAILRELSELTHTPMSALIRELLDDAAPTLQATLETLRVVKACKTPEEARAAAARFGREMLGQAEASHNELQQQLDLDSAMRRKPGRKPGSGKGGARSG